MCKIRMRIWVPPIAIGLCSLLRWGIFQLNASCCIPEEARIFNSLELKKKKKCQSQDGKNKTFCPNVAPYLSISIPITISMSISISRHGACWRQEAQLAVPKQKEETASWAISGRYRGQVERLLNLTPAKTPTRYGRNTSWEAPLTSLRSECAKLKHASLYSTAPHTCTLATGHPVNSSTAPVKPRI